MIMFEPVNPRLFKMVKIHLDEKRENGQRTRKTVYRNAANHGYSKREVDQEIRKQVETRHRLNNA